MTTEIKNQTIVTRFEHARNDHHSKIFYQPLYYISNNIIQNIFKNQNENGNSSIKFKKEMIDEKLEFFPDLLINFEMTNSNNIGSEFSSINDITLNYILDRYNTDLKFKYNGSEFTIKTDKLIKQYPIPISHSENTISSTYEITHNSTDLEKFNMFIKESIIYYHKHFEKITEDSDKLTMYISSSEGNYFEHLGKRDKRTLNTIYLPAKQKQDIIEDLSKFLKPETKQKYKKLGINYKRIYLLSGKPGSGKSSLIMGLASKFNYNIAIISFTPKMTDINLIRGLRSLDENDSDNKNEKNKKFFIVFEDMDCIFKERKHNDESKNSITFSGLLNALDGITTNENLICFITTNYIKHLDSALIRPGRVDYIMNFDYAIKEQIIEIFIVYTCEFYESLHIKKIANSFYDAIQDLNIKVTTSLLQQYLMKYLDAPEEAIKNISELKTMLDDCYVSSLEDRPEGLYN